MFLVFYYINVINFLFLRLYYIDVTIFLFFRVYYIGLGNQGGAVAEFYGATMYGGLKVAVRLPQVVSVCIICCYNFTMQLFQNQPRKTVIENQF